MGWPWQNPEIEDRSHAERKVLVAARNGDRSAFETLRRQHDEALRRFLLRRTAPQTVDDILQETWIAAWRGLPRFGERSSFKAWLYAIAVHKCVNHHRTHSRQLQWETALEFDFAAPGSNSYDAAEMRQAVQSILASLVPQQREVIELYYYDDLTLPEIAKVLQRNLNTVKYQFYRAHTMVTEELAELVPFAGRNGGWQKQ